MQTRRKSVLLQAIITEQNDNHLRRKESAERKSEFQEKESESSDGEEVAEAEEEGGEQDEEGVVEERAPESAAREANAVGERPSQSVAAPDREASALDSAEGACGGQEANAVAGEDRVTKAVPSSPAAPAASGRTEASGPRVSREPDADAARGSGTPRSKSLFESRSNSRKEVSTRGVAGGVAAAPGKGKRKGGPRYDAVRDARHSAQQQLHVPLAGPAVEYIDKLETWRTIELLFAAIKCAPHVHIFSHV